MGKSKIKHRRQRLLLQLIFQWVSVKLYENVWANCLCLALCLALLSSYHVIRFKSSLKVWVTKKIKEPFSNDEYVSEIV